MDIVWPHMAVDVSGVVLGGIITKIFLTRLIEKVEHSLGFLIQEPKVSHFHGPRTLSLDSVGDNAHSCCVVNVNRCWWLKVA